MNKPQFKKIPMCEILHDKPAKHFTLRREKWFFVSTDAPEDFNEYHFKIADFFKSPASTVDWLAHLHEKNWFDPDDFCQMMHRFREATGSFGGISMPVQQPSDPEETSEAINLGFWREPDEPGKPWIQVPKPK